MNKNESINAVDDGSETRGTKIFSKDQLYFVIFGTITPAGKLFDLLLICSILISVVIVIVDSVNGVTSDYRSWLIVGEWFFTVLFTIEYGLRIYCSPNRLGYARSFYGVIDLLAILPTYFGLIVGSANYLIVIRLLRVLRIFRILKLIRYLQEANLLLRAIIASRRKVFVFFATVSVLAVIFGSLMFVIEGPDNGFTSIPMSIYWTIVTITTVGYGDITPHTAAGKALASLVMLTGYSIIAVPTGILTAEINHEMSLDREKVICDNCQTSGHERNANYCRNCGVPIEAESSSNTADEN